MTTIDHPVSGSTRFGLRAGRVFDGERAIGAGVVEVRGTRIAAVYANGPAPAELEVVDLGTDATLLPGLVDTHIHLALDAGPAVVENVTGATDADLMSQMRGAARRVLAAGITTVRDLGDRRYLSLPLREELAADPRAGPRLLCAGPPVTTPKGHCWFLGGEVAGPEELRRAVAEHAERGVDVLKVMATGGELTEGTSSGTPQFDAATLRLLVAEAHRHGLPVAAHAHAAAGIANAVTAGVDTVEHCSFLTEKGVEPDEEVIAALAASGVVASLTLGVAPGLPVPPRVAENLPRLAALLRLIVGSGATFVLGSDAGIGPSKPHDMLPYAVEFLAEATGAVDALAAVTSRAARACGVGDSVGRLAPGYDADLLAVRGDPVVDVRALHDVVAVYRAGVRVADARATPPAEPAST